MSTRIKMTKRGGSKQTMAMLRKAALGAAEEVVSHWHTTYMPIHFTEAGFKKYGYKPRSGQMEPPYVPKMIHIGRGYAMRHVKNPKYFWRKFRQVQTKRPLIWSGRSASAAHAQVRISSRFSRKDQEVKAAAAMPMLQSYFYMYRKDLDQPDKADELTRVAPDESIALHGVYASSFDKLLAGESISGPETVERFG